ncbi:kallikrein-7-like [Periplaneta americana]|uniref:kallikrein-7-like n=1 Tax=Periplaneta americana TaxID=6978 RepID=UPI0037E752E9
MHHLLRTVALVAFLGRCTTTELQSYEYVTTIYNENNTFVCFGAVVTTTWIVSLATCYGRSWTDSTSIPYHARLGVKRQHAAKIEKIFAHPLYDQTKYSTKDLAVLRIKDVGPYMRSENIASISVIANSYPWKLKECTLIGTRSQNSSGKDISTIKVMTTNYRNCERKLSLTGHNRKRKSYFCSMSPPRTRGPCNGKYGGLVECDNMLVGLLASENICDHEFLREYVNIGYYFKWMHSRVPAIETRITTINDATYLRPPLFSHILLYIFANNYLY